MKIRHFLTPSPTLLSLSFGLSFAGCAAAPVDEPDDATGATGGAGGMGNGGTGQGGTGVGGGTGGATVGGATGAGAAGGVGGTGGSSAVITAGVLNSTGGTVAASLCGQATGTAADKLVDDLEDGDNTIGNGVGAPLPPARVGYWFTYNSNTTSCTPLNMAAGSCPCRQLPPPDPQGLIPFPPAPNPGNGSLFAAHTSGTACTVWGAGMGVDFNNCNTKSNAYSVAAYTGISFSYKSTQPIRVLVSTVPNLPTPDGQCPGTDCHNHHGKNFAAATAWTTATITWSELQGTQQIGTPPMNPQTYGQMRTFDPAQVLNLSFQVDSAGGASFDLWVDDVTFL